MSAGHRPGRELIHYVRPPDYRRQRQRTADPFTTADDVRRYAIMLERPELARSPETRLNLIEDQERVIGVAEGGKLPDVFHGREIRPDALISFKHDTRDVLRLQAALFNRFQK